MYESLKISLNSWNENTSDRDKLQHLYIALALALLVAAGVMGLLNQSLGQQILAAAIAAAAVFLINAVAWALLQSFVLLRIREQSNVETVVEKKVTTIKKPRAKNTTTK